MAFGTLGVSSCHGLDEGVLQHEMLHALGVKHEHSRPGLSILCFLKKKFLHNFLISRIQTENIASIYYLESELPFDSICSLF